MKITRFLAATFAVLAIGAPFAHAQEFALKDGDRVVFYGDSITDSRQYTTMAETFVVTRFPKMNLSFVHSGWGGDRVGGGGGGSIDTRLKRDVLAYNPSVVTIMLGMNDGSYRAFDPAIFNTYSTGFQKIVDTLQAGAPNARITAILPSPYDDVTRKPNFDPGYNSVLVRYGDFLRELAPKEKLSVADLNAPVVAMLQKANVLDAEAAPKLIPDRVHPGPGGHLIMAGALLKAWNAPSLVSSVALDGATGKILDARNTQISNIKTEGALSWTQLDGALPFPINTKDAGAGVALAVRSSDVIESLNQQTLRVQNLPGARYTLKIDETEIGTFSKEELTAGLNLATLPTPMMAQAERVAALTTQRANTHNTRWRQIQVPFENDEMPAVRAAVPAFVAALDAKVAALAARQRAEAQPVSHTFLLTAV